MVELITYPILMKQVLIINVAVVVCIMILPSSSSTLAFTPPDRRIPTIKSSTFCRIESLQHRRRINRISCINNIHYQQRQCSSLNLVPFPEAWNANYVDDGMHQSFSTLLYNINCQSLDSDGILISSSSSFLSNEQKKKQYRLYLATDVDDLPPIAKLTLDVFDVSAIAMSNAVDWNAVEAALVGSVVAPAVGAYNAWAYSVGFTEVLSGLRSRMRNRIINDVVGGEERKWNDWLAPLVAPDNIGTSSYNSSSDKSLQDIASRSSLILALAHTITPLDSQEGKEEIEVIASIELRLQPTDAKIPFSQPWLDVIERKLVRFTLFGKSIHHPPLRPYLCNLCISPKFTRLGIGRALCRIVEAIARDKWSYSQIYLHVDPANVAAIQLYEKEGYVDVGSRWNAFWAGGANEISYFVKRLRTGLEK